MLAARVVAFALDMYGVEAVDGMLEARDLRRRLW